MEVIKKMNKNINNAKVCRKRIRMAKKLKITVTAENGRRVAIPGIPFWLVEKLVSLGLIIFRLSQRRKRHKINISEHEIIEILDVIKREPPFVMVEVNDKKGNFVEIKTM